MSEGRKLSEKFIFDLKKGLWKELLYMIQNDHALDLEIRKNYINVYYRGGSLLKVSQKGKGYNVKFEKKYFKTDPVLENEKKEITENPIIVVTENDINTWINRIYILKKVMDNWFNFHPKLEREMQQLVVRENNYSPIANDTDFFIVDIEYANRSIGARFDIIAIQWNSDSSSRKLQKKYKPKLHFFELKYGDNAIGGKSGIVKHLQDFKSFIQNKNNLNKIKKEIIGIFQQKRDLGLIPALKKNIRQVSEFDDSINFGFIFTNHKPAKSKIYRVLVDCNDQIDELLEKNVNIFVGYSNFYGYGLYKSCFYTITEFILKLKDVNED